MPKVDEVGYSESTPHKIEVLSKILAMHYQVTQAVIKKYPNSCRQYYHYVDATAGKGLSPSDRKISKLLSFKPPIWENHVLTYDDQLLGSPLVFLLIAHSIKVTIPYKADFIELEEKNISELKENIMKYFELNEWRKQTEKINYHFGCYQDVVKNLFQEVDESTLGLVFIDPSGKSPDFELIRDVSRLRPKMEILIYLSATNIKRVQTGKLLSDYLVEMGKPNWLISKPVKGDKFQWTFLLGSSWKFKNYKSIDFMDLNSSEAQVFFPKLNLTKRQRIAEKQPPLID